MKALVLYSSKSGLTKLKGVVRHSVKWTTNFLKKAKNVKSLNLSIRVTLALPICKSVLNISKFVYMTNRFTSYPLQISVPTVIKTILWYRDA